MKLSVIVVNHNVKYFLEQALCSVRKATREVEAEVFVVDNASSDGSVDLVKAKFPEVRLIANRTNVGFATANNQAIREARGEYVLLLNPDTVVEEDIFEKTAQFMDRHPEAGALGVKTLDGRGHYLPESKRSLPKPSIAFYKMFGLSALFPKSKIFGQYHLTYLDENAVHEVDVLSGSFMLIRRSVFDKVGLLDETYFMYGEDIDFSYRMTRAGYKNYYFPRARIIHYKGESTKKDSLHYVMTFYKAMLIFARKHFSKQNALLLSILINLAIVARAGMAIISRFSTRFFLPFVDAGCVYGGMYFLKEFWQNNVRTDVRLVYPAIYMQLIVPVYVAIWLVSVYFSGGYDRPFSLRRLVRGLLFGTLLVSAFYGFLSEDYRFSRALTILGAIWAVTASVGIRLVLRLLTTGGFDLEGNGARRLIIVGSRDEGLRVLSLLQQAHAPVKFIGFVSPTDGAEPSDLSLGRIGQLPEIIEVLRAEEVILCGKDLSFAGIIDGLTRIENDRVDFKIVAEGSSVIIGSNSIDKPGQVYSLDFDLAIAKPGAGRNKRLLDLAVATTLLVFSPVVIFFFEHRGIFVRNLLRVLAGKNTLVSYSFGMARPLPKLKNGVLTPLDAFPITDVGPQLIEQSNLLYAKEYTVETDLRILMKGFKKLDRNL